MTLPKRAHGRRRDRHGRGIRGPILDLDSPAYRTRAQKFDDILAWELNAFRTYLGSRLNRYDFAVIDVPPTDPAPWEDGIPLARFLPFERPSKILGRIVFYRLPMTMAALSEDDPRAFIHDVMVSQIATALNIDPNDIDFIGKI
ncbi:metallopeptidase family protein [Arcanobacterium pinnipediorum]|uniref:Metallopeptidase family protein n=1 Tax=Arcanobacterium pinnipediorum TaxID=1503041 RepID=A0ABY5AJ86_9ACTO|nr:metallopeptidase family protein [Arcanobacterium pinnipediorum]USR80254.1 metallopeptidase family protein [Arcanobacterium pinnipediorum]